MNLKKKIAMLLTVVMLLTTWIPLQGFAAGMDQGLQRAIERAKGLFSVPDSYDGFEANYYMRGNVKTWVLYWYDKEGDSGSMTVTVDDQGVIRDYYKSSQDVYSGQKKFPAVTKKEAVELAKSFIKRVNPGIFSHVAYIDNDLQSIHNSRYYLRFYRVENGIPFYNNTLDISVDAETGEIRNYSLDWTDGLIFPKPSKAITVVDAQNAYKKNLGLELIYRYSYQDDTLKVYPVYAPVADNAAYAVDAFTGEKIRTGFGYYIVDDNAMKEDKVALGGSREASVVITPQEKEQIDKLAGLLDEDEAEKIARETEYLGITDAYELNRKELYKRWMAEDEYIYSLSFFKEASAVDKNDYCRVNVDIDARTGAIVGFYTYKGEDNTGEPQFDRVTSRVMVEEFLAKHFNTYFMDTEYDASSDNEYLSIPADAEKPRAYSFRFVRKVNGIKFPDNGLTVTLNAVDGTVSNFALDWFTADIPALDGAIDAEEAYQYAFADKGLELSYRVKYESKSDKVVDTASDDVKPTIALVYAFNTDIPLYFDAFTGERLDYDGQPYKEATPIRYTDIAGHYAEKHITALAEYGIGLPGTVYMPDEGITQKDFLLLLSKIADDYYGPVIKEDSTSKDIDAFYSALIRGGIVKENEKAPDAKITREESTKFFLRILKYDPVAELKGIFNCPFKDAGKVNPALVGYVTIAYGLGIIRGDAENNYHPDAALTRADAAIMVYSYLQR